MPSSSSTERFPFFDPRLERILEMRKSRHSLREIGGVLGITRTRVGQILRAAGHGKISAIKRNSTPDERFLDQVMPEPNSGCWLWIGTLSAHGYGSFWNGETNVTAHRYSYERVRGPVPVGLELDHKCRVHCCVNPDHLEPVTHQENVRRGLAPILSGKRKLALTHCPQGHPYAGENLGFDRRGYRICLTCAALWAQSQNARAREKYHARHAR